jgi:hypothetical protein
MSTITVAAPSSRRDFLLRSAGGLATAGLFGGSALLLLSRKTAAQSGQPWPFDTTASLAVHDTAWTMYTTQWTDANAAAAFSNAIVNFQANLDALGFNAQFAAQINNNAASSPAFDANLQQLAFDASSALNWGYPKDFFTLMGDAQPTPDQVACISDAQTFDIVHYGQAHWATLASQVLSSGSGGGSGALAVRPNGARPNGMNTAGQRTVSQHQAEVGAAGGGVMVAGGGTLMMTSGTTAATLFAAETTTAAFSAFTGGLFLVIVGIGVAGYYGWQYLQQQQAVQPVATLPVRAPIDHEDY